MVVHLGKGFSYICELGQDDTGVSIEAGAATRFIRLAKLIEDYLSKATHTLPSQAYHGLPGLPVEGVSKFSISDLSDAERTRIFRAFIRHELLCRLHRANIFSEHSSSTNKWAWNALELIEFRTSPPEETEAVFCVHQYFCSLYGAVLARRTGAWVPTCSSPPRVVPYPRDRGLLYPDNMYFDPTVYGKYSIPKVFPRHVKWEHIISTFAGYGMDLVIWLIKTRPPLGRDGPASEADRGISNPWQGSVPEALPQTALPRPGLVRRVHRGSGAVPATIHGHVPR